MGSSHVCPYLMVQPMQVTPQSFHLGVVVRLEGGLPLGHERPHFHLYSALVERAHHVVVLVRVDPERLTERRQ